MNATLNENKLVDLPIEIDFKDGLQNRNSITLHNVVLDATGDLVIKILYENEIVHSYTVRVRALDATKS